MCYSSKNSINPQKIDVAFIDDKNSEVMILGLKKGYNNDFIAQQLCIF